MVVTSGVAVVLASAAFLAYDYNSFRERMVTDLATTADGVGLLASSALDAETADGAAGGVGTQAREALALIMGSLRAYPSIDHGVVFDANGRAVGGHERNILVSRPTPRVHRDRTRTPSPTRGWCCTGAWRRRRAATSA